MRISATVFVILMLTYIVNASVLDPVIENVVHLKASKPPSGVSGIWKKKTIWKPRWVKEWKSAKVMKPIWRKVWSPVQIREWVPIPKPPPGWDAISTPLAPVHPKSQKAPLKDLQGHDSFPAPSSTKVPLWDPVPYPESQQPPPPPPFSQPLHNSDVSCDKGACDNSPSHTFNHQQILEIIGPRYQTPEHFQNPEYSETVNHLTRLPPEGNNWRPPQPQSIQLENIFNSFPRLPEFLIPPKTQPQQENVQFLNNQAPPVNAVGPPPGFEVQNSLRWTPLPPENKFKNHVITTKGQDHQYKFELPEVQLRNQNNATVGRQNSDTELKEKPNFQTQNISSGLRPQADGNFIQEAQLVGEYHYSEFDLPSFKPVPDKPQPILQEDQAKAKPLQSVKTEQREGLQKPTTNQKTAAENKPTQTRTQIKQPEVHTPRAGSQIQKKHIPNPPPNSNFQQQEAVIKEIFPIFKAPRTPNPNLASPPANHKNQEKPLPVTSTKLTAVAATQPNSTKTDFDSPQEKNIYPIYERPQIADTNNFPPNHRFSFSSNDKQEKPFPSNHNSTKLVMVAPSKPTKPENPIFDKTNSLQLVFATTPIEHNLSTEDFKKPKTTEPYEIVFSSSLLSTTEAVTKSPVIIVTPISSKS